MISPIGADRDADAGRQLAERHRASTAATSSTAGLAARRRRMRTSLWEIRDAVEASPRLAASPEGQWLLDNDHVIEEALLELESDLPASFLRQLPAVRLGDRPASAPRVHEIATSALDRSGGEADPAALRSLVEGYQEVDTLALGELWALPSLLRQGVLERLERAGRDLLAAAAPRPSTAIRTAIHSLRRLAAHDWRLFIDQVSAVERELSGDPADVYRRMDFATRDRYRKAVEELGGREGGRELAVARAAVAASREAAPGSRESHVGYFLVDRGQTELAARTRPPARHRLPSARLARQIERRPGTFFFGGIASVTGVLIATAMLASGLTGTHELVLATVFLLLPALTLAVSLVNWIATHAVGPRPLPKLDLAAGIPPEHRTLVVVPALLAGTAEVRSLLHRLEVNRLANRDPQLGFALLTDWVDAPHREMPEDRELLREAVEGVEAIHRAAGSGGEAPVLLLHRERRWNPAQGCWMGWERKRGKLEELGRLLEGAEDAGFDLVVGDRSWLAQVRFVITLDADTVLPHEAARRLVATIAHPLNRARLAPSGDRVEAGYAVLQPRVEISPASANRTRLAKTLAGAVGLDLYNRAISDVYQDLFGEGLYAGKGIYEPCVFRRCLESRVPENALLSHDLFEGLHARAGLVSDITVLEEQPGHVWTYLGRLHRWVRGDWQLLPWLLPRVPVRGGGRARNRLSLLDRWKILDNLRRSLIAPALLVLLILGWTLLPGDPWLWTLLALGALAVSLPLEALSVTWRLVRGGPWLHVLGESVSALRVAAARLGVELVLLPAQAAVSLDAVVRTLGRLGLRRRLLEWTSAARADSILGGRSAPAVWWRLAPGPAVSLGVAGLLEILDRSWAPAAPFLLLWLVSPLLALWLSSSRPVEPSDLSPERLQGLRRLARRTWHFFEVFVGPGDHWLPPDNHQEDPGPQTARRTSPTNIGLYLVSTFTAWDLGYLDVRELAARLGSTLETLGRLDRYRGHVWNWISTESLAPLEPRYVSTVDSGNLAASLMTVAQGCREALGAPLSRPQALLGLADTVGVLRDELERAAGLLATDDGAVALAASLAKLEARLRAGSPGPAVESLPVLQELIERDLPAIELAVAALVGPGASAALDPEAVARLGAWVERLHHGVVTEARALELLGGWRLPLAAPPSLLAEPAAAQVTERVDALVGSLPAAPVLEDLAGVCGRALAKLPGIREAIDAVTVSRPAVGDGQLAEARDWLDRLAEALDRAALEAERLVAELRSVGRRAGALVDEMDLGFLYDPDRKLFHIGFDATSGRLDPHHYDLLASEARLASIVAIGRGEVPVEHWIHLGRPFARVAGARALVSWAGTAFEYLMPNLFLPTPEGTPLETSCRAAIRAQEAFARRHRMPWGTSESGFHALGAHGWYQYRAFGVPGTGLKRGLGDRLVVSPYASLLALGLAPASVDRNLDRFEALGMRGRYGMFEAADFGMPWRGQQRRPRARLVRSYMSHHQGMILASLGNHLADGALLRRFRADARVGGVEALLWEERRLAPLTHSWALEERAPSRHREALPSWPVPSGDLWPQAQVFSNGRYRCVLTRDGGGGSQWRGIELTPWDPDPTLEEQGCWIYLQDLDSDALWSVGREPTGREGGDLTIELSPHHAEIRRRDDEILVRFDLCVGAHEDLEIRRVRLVNEGDRVRRLSVTSYAEVALASAAERSRHPAFARLFVAAEVADPGILLFHRRARGPAEEPVWVGWALAPEPATEWELDRGRFVGRGRSRRDPRALGRGAGPWARGAVDTLDPVAALRRTLTLAPGERTQIAVITAAGPSRSVVLDILRRHRSAGSLEATFQESRDEMTLRYHALDCGPEIAPAAQRLLSAVLFPHPDLRAEPSVRSDNRLGLEALWGFGVSGDAPIVLVRLGPAPDRTLVAQLLRVHALWRWQGVTADLVLVDEEAEGYDWPLRDWLDVELERTGAMEWLHQSGGVFVLRGREVPAEQRSLLLAVAAVVLDGAAGDLAAQLAPLEHRPARLPEFVPVPSAPPSVVATEPLSRPLGLLLDNGLGGFDADGAYVVHLAAGERTPAPWINVISNPRFGFQVSESGGGSTWSIDSGENRLTPWSNDPVIDAPGEALLLRDEETGEVWSPTPAPAGADADYQVTHAPGLTRFRHRSHGLDQTVEVFAAGDAPVKLVTLRLEDLWRRGRRLTATYVAEWVLGSRRARTAPFLVTDYAPDHHTLLAHHSLAGSPSPRTAFLVADRAPHGFTTDRNEVFGQGGSRARPAALARIGLSDTASGAGDPCAALQVHLQLPASGSAGTHFVLGQGETRDAALELAARFRAPEVVAAVGRDVVAGWNELTALVQVSTPEPEIDLLVNRWLVYQSLSCRVWGRGALYQAGGAFGFRDQLQDACALLLVTPGLAREHILEAAARQFEAGDVLHWWHPRSTRGVRSRCSDDLVWLPWAVLEYLDVTGDDEILDQTVPFLAGPELGPGEVERYDSFATSDAAASAYEHCLRALERASTRGAHGLPLIGSGDWNDALSRVGVEGRGESVWLAWFLGSVLRRFAAVCESRGDEARAARLRSAADGYRQAAEREAWDGSWYLRAYYDDGSPLGSSQDAECRIDLVAQSWAVLSGEAAPERAAAAMEAAYRHLVERDPAVVRLLAPPFGSSRRDPGYIRAYPPGVRENGGQYNHAAIWAAWAWTSLGDGDRALEIERLVNPLSRADDRGSAGLYRLEPYAVAGDVCASPPLRGRGGWSWYTGSAGWLFRLVVEAMLGIRRRRDRLVIAPCIPSGWPGFEVALRHGQSTLRVRVENPEGVSSGVERVLVDGVLLADGEGIPLRDDGETHQVTVRLGGGRRQEGSALDAGSVGRSSSLA
ncbi:MAG TPA: glucoamylase family protein [Thermoanaerobaculia bacterium]|nr:glucoamylase family protein [Thermoanaerobaculia bacterium]